MKLIDAKRSVIINKGAQRFYFIYLFSICCCCGLGRVALLGLLLHFVCFLPMINCPL